MTVTVEQTGQVWLTQLTGEVLLFNLLGKLLHEVPARKWLQPLVDDEVFTEAPFAEAQPDVTAGLAMMAKWCRTYQQAGRPDDEFKALQVDYTNLLTGVGKFPVAPWESVFFSDDRLVFQAQTLDVRAWYRRYGLEIRTLHQEPDDHIGLELMFVAHLAQRGLAALEAGDDLAFEELLAAQRGFLGKHLFLWTPLWCKQMVEYAQTDFYRGLALVVRGALLEMGRILEMPLPEGWQS